MKIAFLSGVQFGLEILNEIIAKKFKIDIVFSYEDSKKNIYSDYTSFDDLCKTHGIFHVKVKNINDLENVKILKSINPDLILVMGWSQLLKDEILSIPKLGIIGSHPTELPKYRGRAPIPWTILKNLKETAMTFFYIEKGVDDGDIIDQQKFKIEKTDDATIIYNKMTEMGKKMIIKNLTLIQNNSIKRIKQNPSHFLEYWKKRNPDDGLIDWNNTSQDIDRLIRATTHPYPGAFTFFKGHKLKIWKSTFSNDDTINPGRILEINSNGIKVGTKKGCISLQRISIENESESDASKIFSANDIGQILG